MKLRTRHMVTPARMVEAGDVVTLSETRGGKTRIVLETTVDRTTTITEVMTFDVEPEDTLLGGIGGAILGNAAAEGELALHISMRRSVTAS